MVNFMANPSSVLWEYLERSVRAPVDERDMFMYGQLALALEIVSLIKNLESYPVVTELGRQEAISALHTLLVEKGLADQAYEVYDVLCEWRRPKFDRIPVVPDERVPRGIAVVVGPYDGRPPGPQILGVLSFQTEGLADVESQQDTPPVEPQERQSLDMPPTFELEELNDVGD